MKNYDRHEERTGVQENADFNSVYDVQSDFVMVYGFHDLKNRIAHWKKRGYVVHLMTGVSWGEYQDYLYGKFDGIDHHDEGQRERDHEINHGVDVPYMVPSNSFAHYLASNLRKAVDYGVEAIHLEEPEFWVRAGYSDAFKREWKIFYKEDWQDPQSSPEAQYRASKLKQYLYTRTLDRLCSELKEYALVKYGRLLRFYVPTHSLINYSQWMIVSPESALIDLPTIDGYIAQIWTGTSRTANIYRGVFKERTFETAFLEYGVMQELVRGTGRRMWYLADPIEDDPNHTWVDYRENYYRTVTASLFHPEISDYEVAPWPQRVMKGHHQLCDGGESGIIPSEYKTNLVTVMHALRDMKDQKDSEWMTKTAEVALMLADSAMFERLCGQDNGLDFSSFYGLALPLVKNGIAARPVQLDNIKRFAGYLDPYKTMVLSYEFMKPQSPDINALLANWVRGGGHLVYVGDGSDPFMNIREWWNSGLNNYANPAEHLFEVLGLTRTPEEGEYKVGEGAVLFIKDSPKNFAHEPRKADDYYAKVKLMLASQGIETETSSKLILRRGAYFVTAVMDEGDKEGGALHGSFINMYDHTLPVIENPELEIGSVGLWFDVSRIDKSENSSIIALSGRADKITQSQRSLSFTVMAPSQMNIAGRVWTKRPPKSIKVTIAHETTDIPFEYEPDSETTYFTYPAGESDAKVVISF